MKSPASLSQRGHGGGPQRDLDGSGGRVAEAVRRCSVPCYTQGMNDENDGDVEITVPPDQITRTAETTDQVKEAGWVVRLIAGILVAAAVVGIALATLELFVL